MSNQQSIYIDEGLLTSTYKDALSHLKVLTQSALSTIDKANRAHSFNLYKALDTIKCINDFCSLHNLEKIRTDNVGLSTATNILQHLTDYYMNIALNSNASSFSHYFETTKYSFNDTDYTTIQNNLNQLREDIANSTIFSDEHKARLLKKLEQLQAELHKKMNSLDKALGQITSIGATLGQFGEDAKPFFDRINETFKLIRKTEDKGDGVVPPENQIEHKDFMETNLLETPTDLA
jgi:uncharacterized protein YoxC